MNNSEFTCNFIFTGGESDANGRIPPTLIVERLIEVATFHANELGIGYDRLIADNLAWVLSRVAYRLDRSPAINETYSISTWIESWNRVYSARCFRIAGSNGEVIGRGRSVWVAIDIEKRTPADLTPFSVIAPAAVGIDCELPAAPRIRPLMAGDIAREEIYTFKYSDLDFNGHVNSTKYIAHLLDLHSPDYYKENPVESLDITFLHECRYDETADIVANDRVTRIDFVVAGRPVVVAALGYLKATTA